ncbi:MFS transporter [Amaricoccus tamworthensis]|uniref:MFS transporter n=1 Tax=Amaricoccus tamworthensis TaxID=57002 RepID=UPI003C79F487
MHKTSAPLFTPVLVAASLILLVAFGIRASFGLFQIPIAEQFNWPRAEFSMAIAIQNLAWGFGQPIFAAIGEKFGDRRAIILGAIAYAGGLALSAWATTPLGHQLLNIVIGFGIAGTGFGVILAVVGRAASDENRSMALGIATAIGSAGQFAGPLIADVLLRFMDWSGVFLVFAVVVLATILLTPILRGIEKPSSGDDGVSMMSALKEALKDPSFTFIFLGFFSCGYQLGFVTAHFPAFITEVCGPVAPGGILDGLGISTTSAVGALSIGLIGIANIGGTLMAGYVGKYINRKYVLSLVYLGRTIAATLFIMTPMTPTTVIVFSLVMGSLWLATVPLTSGLIAQIYGVKYMGTLYGIVFFSHQVGSFMGVWLGGELYDVSGTYNLVWWVGIGVGAFSALIHLPVRNTPLRMAAV